MPPNRATNSAANIAPQTSRRKHRAANVAPQTHCGKHGAAGTVPSRHAAGRAARWPRFASGPSGSAAGRLSADGSARPHLTARRRQSRGRQPQPTRFSPVYGENSPPPAPFAATPADPLAPAPGHHSRPAPHPSPATPRPFPAPSHRRTGGRRVACARTGGSGGLERERWPSAQGGPRPSGGSAWQGWLRRGLGGERVAWAGAGASHPPATEPARAAVSDGIAGIGRHRGRGRPSRNPGQPPKPGHGALGKAQIPDISPITGYSIRMLEGPPRMDVPTGGFWRAHRYFHDLRWTLAGAGG